MTLVRFLVIAMLIYPLAGAAHPIAQGLIQLKFQKGLLLLQMQVHAEQVFVANHFMITSGANLESTLKDHATYIQDHLFISADGKTLKGKLEDWVRSGPERIDYSFSFPIPLETNQLTLRQNILNEIDYAPGNPWEATYQVVIEDESSPGSQRYLLTSRKNLDVAIHKDQGTPLRLFADYVDLGISHILEGTDHLLFIGALVIGTRRFWELFRIITAFTIAHSLTLTLSVLDLFRLSPVIVEPMIALSIVVVALYNLFPRLSQKQRFRAFSALFFGLFHGLGFSGGLLEVIDTADEIGLAIIAFTIGVELGHQVVIVPLFAALFTLHNGPHIPRTLSHLFIRLCSALILIQGLYFFWIAIDLPIPD